MIKTLVFTVLTALLVLSISCSSIAPSNKNDHLRTETALNNKNLGRVRWLSDYNTALLKMAEENKPMLVYILGNTGNDVLSVRRNEILSHPLIVEAIESNFIPVAVSPAVAAEHSILSLPGDTKTGTAMSIVGTDGHPKSKNSDDAAWMKHLTGIMLDALQQEGMAAPVYLKLVNEEFNAAEKRESAVITLHCFWSGEVELGIEHGIVYTEPGYIGDKEALYLEFNGSAISYEDILKSSLDLNLINEAFPMNEQQSTAAHGIMPDKKVVDTTADAFVPAPRKASYKRYLSKSIYRFVPMTEKQAIMVNNALFLDEDPSEFLSPRQLQMYRYIKRKQYIEWQSRVHDPDFPAGWQETTSLINSSSRGKIQIQ